MTKVLDPLLDDSLESFTRGLRGYLGEVAQALGVGLESCAIDPDPPAWAYVALDVRLPRFPERDLALLWDERFGWAAAVETYSGEDLLVVAYHGGDLLLAPSDVVTFVAALTAGQSIGRRTPPEANMTQRRAVARRLRGYFSL